MGGTSNPPKRARMDDSAKDTEANVNVIFPEEFEQILKERKAVRKHLAEGTRLEGLRKIRERNSKTGVDPLTHFPREMWTKILEKLGPKDKANVIGVHPLFHDLMTANQVGDIYFPLLLDRETGFIQKYFHCQNTNSNVLKLRYISRSIQQAIDKWFEDDLEKFWRPPSEDRWRRFKCLEDWCRIPLRIDIRWNEEDLEEILEIEKPMKIFQRQCCVLVFGPQSRGNGDEEIEQLRHSFNIFWTNMTKALEQVGDQIWHFEFYSEDIQNFGVTRTQVCALLKEWLRHLPNLRFLDICFNGYAFEGCGHDPIDRSLLDGESSFPKFHALKRLDFQSGEDHDLSLICKSLIRANPHIKIFNYGGGSSKDRRAYLNKPQIQALELEGCQLGDVEFSTEWPEFQEIIPIILLSSWNLKMLELCINADVSNLKVNSFIKFLNHLSTLEHVNLHVDQISFSSEDIDFLRLPNLRHFGIEFRKIIQKSKRKYRRNIHFFFCLQFLIHSEQLRSFRWSNLSREALDYLALVYFNGPSEGMLDFCGGCYDMNLRKSNLWDVFPMLEEVEVKSISSSKPTRVTRSNRNFGG